MYMTHTEQPARHVTSMAVCCSINPQMHDWSCAESDIHLQHNRVCGVASLHSGNAAARQLLSHCMTPGGDCRAEEYRAATWLTESCCLGTRPVNCLRRGTTSHAEQAEQSIMSYQTQQIHLRVSIVRLATLRKCDVLMFRAEQIKFKTRDYHHVAPRDV